MITESHPVTQLERPGRLNESLVRHGGLPITTDATGAINLTMLIDVLRDMGVTMRTCVSNPMGFYHVVFSQQGMKRGDHCVESAAVAPSRESAIAEAALAALLIHSPR